MTPQQADLLLTVIAVSPMVVILLTLLPEYLQMRKRK